MIALKKGKQQKSFIVEVIPLAGFDAQLAYKVPVFLKEKIVIGLLARIQLRNQSELGVIVQIGSDQDVPPNKLKSILEIVQPLPVLTKDLFPLFKWCVSYYASNYESVLETIIPSFVRKGMRSKQKKMLSLNNFVDTALINSLEKKAPKQYKVLRYMAKHIAPQSKNLIAKRMGISLSVFDALVTKGFLKEFNVQDEREAYADVLAEEKTEVSSNIKLLTDEQCVVTKKLSEAVDKKTFGVEVVHGVTGSGKTEVYLQAVSKVVKRGGGVIFLVPEVALAPQTVSRVRDRLESKGVKTVVWHSHLSDGERYDAWKSLISGEGRVVVGARSAIFAPVKNLELIIVDEEHEPAYKQEESPRYHGRDVAVYRAFLNNAVCILGSATPSLETIYNVSIGKYKINKILKRVDNRQLPKIHIVDMRREGSGEQSKGPISQMLADKIRDRYAKKEQTILFLNRRGYASNFMCEDCGHVIECKHCSIPMTLHRTDWTLKCHLCGDSYKVPRNCPECKREDVLAKGYGTQRIEDVVRKIIPNAKIVRMDADVMSKKNLFRAILKDFRIGKIDLLVGTQMIAKGLDFPNVTLVGLVDADRSLHVEDFRATERTFQLIVQVSGRSGRGDRAGEVVVQTRTPQASPILYARQSDFDGFLIEALEQRKEFQYPPYRHLIRHLFVGRNPEKVEFYMKQWLKELKLIFGCDLDIKGPVPTPIEKIKDEYRFQFWYFTPSVARVMEQLSKQRNRFKVKLDKDVREWIDVDPMQMS